jgi:hypothetical protein
VPTDARWYDGKHFTKLLSQKVETRPAHDVLRRVGLMRRRMLAVFCAQAIAVCDSRSASAQRYDVSTLSASIHPLIKRPLPEQRRSSAQNAAGDGGAFRCRITMEWSLPKEGLRR